MAQALIDERFQVHLSHSSVCRLLHQLGLSAHRGGRENLHSAISGKSA